MTSTEFLRLITATSSSLTIIYMSIKFYKIKRIRNLLIFPFSLVLNILVRAIFVLITSPLTPPEIVIYNNWSLVILIQTIIMVFSLTLYLSMKEKLI